MLLDSGPFMLCAIAQKMSPIFLTRFDRARFLISFRHLSSMWPILMPFIWNRARLHYILRNNSSHLLQLTWCSCLFLWLLLIPVTWLLCVFFPFFSFNVHIVWRIVSPCLWVALSVCVCMILFQFWFFILKQTPNTELLSIPIVLFDYELPIENLIKSARLESRETM